MTRKYKSIISYYIFLVKHQINREDKLVSKISVINVSGEIEQSYIEELEKNSHIVKSVSSNEADAAIKMMDLIIIYNDVQQNMGEVCRLILKIREYATSFLWIFSKQNSETDRLVYLQLGADNNLSEQCLPEELKLIVQKTVDQYTNLNKEGDDLFCTSYPKRIKLLPSNLSIMMSTGQEVELTKLEYKLIEILDEHSGETVRYEDLYKKLWNEDNKRTTYRVANLVFHLRSKLDGYGVDGVEIRTVRSQGYRLLIK